jgi:hypothetical protein
MYQPEKLERWKMPRDYFGAEWPEYYSSGVGRSRDSDCLEESNFHSMLAELGGESDTVQVVRESHWAVGWVEWIAIHESDEKSLRSADAMLVRLDDYPVLDEEDWSNREHEECERVWSDVYNASERVKYLRERGCTAGFRELRAAAGGDWSAACNLLPCPSDLLS